MPASRNEFIVYPNGIVRIAVLPIMDDRTLLNKAWKLVERVYRLREFTHGLLMNPLSSKYWSLFTTQNEWTTVKYVMEVFKPYQYWTLWMSK
jgi:hypothetical protein